tara:strand:+ start:508 stop:1227 length:720 start_codon:yes stop_codon:yes gene_type:complete
MPRKPILSELIKKQILDQSVLEVQRLEELTDEYILFIETNEAAADKYYKQLQEVRAALEKIAQFWVDTKKTRDKVKKAIKTAKIGVKTADAADKTNTIAGALNPAAAALQFAAKLLKDEIKFELNHLTAVADIIAPAQDQFIRFAGGTLSDGKTKVDGTFNEKIHDMEIRLRKKNDARKKRDAALKRKKQMRRGYGSSANQKNALAQYGSAAEAISNVPAPQIEEPTPTPPATDESDDG